MTCHDAEDIILDALCGAADTAARASLTAHMSQCPQCQLLAISVRAAANAIVALPIPEPNATSMQRARANLMLAVRGARSTPSRDLPFITRIRRMSSRMRYVTQGLLTAAAGAILTFIIIGHPTQSAGTTRDPQPHFMLLIMENLSAPQPTGPELQQVIAEHRAWAQRLEAEGRLVAAEKLTDDDGRGLPVAKPTAGGAPPATERIGGFYIIRASDYDDAAKIANEGPVLKYGGRVQIRKIDKV